MTRDEELLDELLLLASAGGVEVCVAVDAVAAEKAWASAPVVVVGADAVSDVARRGLPRRLGVVLVAGPGRADDDGLWPGAEALYAEHVAVLPDARSWLVTRFAEHGPGGPGLSARATTVAVVPGSASAAAAELSVAIAVTAQGHGAATLLVSTAVPPLPANPTVGLAMLRLGRSGEASVAPDVMAAALQAGRAQRDLVVVDLPYGLDEASLLALTCADRANLVVVAEVRACATATRVAAAVRRHCPALTLVVRATGPHGLRPGEVAQALDLPLAGVLPQAPVPQRRTRHAEDGPLTRLSRRLLVDLDLRGRPTRWAWPATEVRP